MKRTHKTNRTLAFIEQVLPTPDDPRVLPWLWQPTELEEMQCRFCLLWDQVLDKMKLD